MKSPFFYVCRSVSAVVICLFFSSLAFAQTSAFTYQGRLNDSTLPQPTNDVYDFQFTLWDALTAGTQQPQPTPITSTITGVNVSNGIFSVTLDFGTSPFTGASRFLQIAVKKSTDPTYTVLTPRQRLTASPYALRTLSAASADFLSGSCNGCVSNAQINSVDAAKITGTLPIANGGTGSSTQNFVDLTTSQTIGGTKTFSGAVDTNSQYNIGGNAVVSVPGTDNLFVGIFAGRPALTGTGNLAIGKFAGFKITSGSGNSFIGTNSGANTTTGGDNTFFGANAGIFNDAGIGNSLFGNGSGSFTNGSFNTFVGLNTGQANTTGTNNTAIGAGANFGANNLVFATAIGSGAVVSNNNTIALGRNSGADRVQIFGLGAAGSTTLCRNANNEISNCSSSLRYKTNISSFNAGMSFINQLRPITFDWKQGGIKDVGFGAEDIAKINPLFVNYNEKGEVEGVKYDRLSVAFVNAFKEQQAQIEQQQKQIDEQKTLIEELKKLVCLQNPTAGVCK